MGNTVRDMAMLLSEHIDMVSERNDIVGHPLGYVHGTLGRLRDMLGPEVKLRVTVDGDGMTCTVVSPVGVQLFGFSDADYDMDIEMLAGSIRKICEQRGLIAKAKG